MSYYGNPKYITEALINKKVDCQIIWLSKSYKAITSEKIKVNHFIPYDLYFICAQLIFGLITVEKIIGAEKEIKILYSNMAWRHRAQMRRERCNWKSQ